MIRLLHDEQLYRRAAIHKRIRVLAGRHMNACKSVKGPRPCSTSISSNADLQDTIAVPLFFVQKLPQGFVMGDWVTESHRCIFQTLQAETASFTLRLIPALLRIFSQVHAVYTHLASTGLTHPVCAGASFDGVIASEVIEHVPDPEGFCKALAGLADPPKGLVVVSTINRTPRSYALAIVAAERLLRFLPVGTHDWNRFITPGKTQYSITQFPPQLQRSLEPGLSFDWDEVRLCLIGSKILNLRKAGPQ